MNARALLGVEARRRGTLTALVHRFATGNPKPDLTAHLRLGLVQLLFLDGIPDHAAVGETVRLVKERFGPGRAGYVNAVLRAVIQARRAGTSGDPRRDLALRELHFAEPVFPDPAEHPLLWVEDALSMPAALVRRWSRRHGMERAISLARAALVEPEISLRVTGSREHVAAELETAGCPTRPGLHERILLAPSDATEKVLRLASFAEGRLSVQGETALRSAELANAREGERVLDLCAAPGGKTVVLAESGASVVACDSSASRLDRVRQNLARCAPAAQALLLACDAGAGLADESFDAVLVDAPCSNTGVLAQRPEARWRFNAQTRGSLGELQERLLAAAARLVRPGGRIVYSTCSIEQEENARRVAAFLAAHADFALEEELDALPGEAGGAGPIDGGYAARIVRTTATS